MNCPNCDAKITCGCQKRVASDLKEVCSSCIDTYEKELLKIEKEKILINERFL